ncbi:MAG: DUF1361 domain-containing protein [Chloroflexaceae bacterium]|jgi:uncharacterized membrane protein|nr:DUF1361 domain-containing protein [Chloroflexaceae bacterium]
MQLIVVIHRFLAQRLFYPLVLSTMLALGIFAGRVWFTGTWDYRFLVWNLFLAWIPYLFSLWAATTHQRKPGQWWRLLLPGAVWLLFFPNAPYIMTDFVHFPGMDFVWWYDLAFLASFAWTGCFLAVASLQQMQALVRAYLGGLMSWLFVLATMGLNGLGIYLGRFLRFNSWDVLAAPDELFRNLARLLLNPHENPRMVGVTLVFAALLFVCYVTVIGTRHMVEESASTRQPSPGLQRHTSR